MLYSLQSTVAHITFFLSACATRNQGICHEKCGEAMPGVLPTLTPQDGLQKIGHVSTPCGCVSLPTQNQSIEGGNAGNSEVTQTVVASSECKNMMVLI